MEGFIKLHRRLLDWEWYKDGPTKAVYIHLLLKASWITKNYRGQLVPNGTVVTTIKELSEELRLTEQQIRTAINHLKSTKEITTKSTNKYTLIHIEKWQYYQCDEERINEAVNKVFQNR